MRTVFLMLLLGTCLLVGAMFYEAQKLAASIASTEAHRTFQLERLTGVLGE